MIKIVDTHRIVIDDLMFEFVGKRCRIYIKRPTDKKDPFYLEKM